jgi:RimJ/RimL family protein N-acetyltransferase
MAGYAHQTPESLTERTAGLEAQLEGSADQTRFTIYRHHDGTWTPIGMTSLLIDDRYRTGEFFIYIGEPDQRGHGTGTTATTMVLDRDPNLWSSSSRSKDYASGTLDDGAATVLRSLLG